MNPKDYRLFVDLVAARYLDALENDDHAAMEGIWKLAAEHPDLEKALHEVHEGLLEEQAQADLAAAEAALAKVVEKHLPSAEIVRSGDRPVTVADVADELYRHTPDRLPAEAHALNEKLRGCREPLPPELGLTKLAAWGDAKFGAAPIEYWQAFRRAAVKMQLQRTAASEYRLAARPAPKPEEKP